MADDKVATAIDAIARRILIAVVERAADDVAESWGDYPDLGERDWSRICEQVEIIAGSLAVSPAEYRAAYEFLAERADRWSE